MQLNNNTNNNNICSSNTNVAQASRFDRAVN